jgi:transposase
MTRSTRYPAETRERALGRCGWCGSIGASIHLIGGDHLDRAERGINHETLRVWLRQAQTDAGRTSGLTTDEREQLKVLQRENRELRRANEVLKSAAIFFATELDGRQPRLRALSMFHRPRSRTCHMRSRWPRCAE